MEPHLSDLAIDRFAALGAPIEPHLQECVPCRRRLELFTRQRASVMAGPRYQELRRQLVAAPPRRSHARWAALGALAAAVLVAVIFVRPRPPQTRLKGGLSLEVSPERGQPREVFAPGETVSLRLSAAGHPYALVLAVDPEGRVSTLWPPHASASGLAPTGDGAPLAPSFRVTPGDLRLWAFFSDAPISAERARESLDRGIEAARAHGASSLAAEPEPVDGETGRASADFHVEAAR